MRSLDRIFRRNKPNLKTLAQWVKSLFSTGVNGAWYDPSDINLTWRRNLLTYSEQFDNAAWGKNANVSVTANFDAAPDGSITADRFVSTGGAFPQTAQVVNNLVAGQAYTFSVWVKSDGTQQIAQSILLESGVTTFIPTSTWTRVSVTVASSAGGSRSVVIATNRGSAPSSSFIIWGAQLEQGSTATAYQRITDGIKDYLDYNPLPILYQDAAGTTPVTAVGQPVGLMLDKSKGLVLGPELVTNGDFSDGTTGWTVQGTTFSIDTVNKYAVATNATFSSGLIYRNAGITAGKTYKITFTVSNYSSGWAGIVLGGSNQYSPPFTANGTYSVIITAASNVNGNLGITPVSGQSAALNCTFDNISVRELPGNHAFNPSGNSANFPVLSARYNLLTKTEDFSDAAWTLFNVSGAASRVGNTITFGASASDRFMQSGKTLEAVSCTGSIELSGSGSVRLYLLGGDGSTGVPTSVTLSGTPTRYAVTRTPAGAGAFGGIGIYNNYAGTPSTVTISFPDLRVTNDALNQPAYQRVNTATDYDTVGFKPYLSFNGVNQWLQTNSIDFTYGDKMFVAAGVRKLSDAAQGAIAELSSTIVTNLGSWVLFDPPGVGTSTVQYRSNGTLTVSVTGTAAPPVTQVLSGTSDISAPNAVLRVNGSQVAQSTASQGTGNYGNYPLYIGARTGSSLWFNGRLYGLVVAGKAASASEIASTEAWLNQKTGAY